MKHFIIYLLPISPSIHLMQGNSLNFSDILLAHVSGELNDSQLEDLLRNHVRRRKSFFLEDLTKKPKVGHKSSPPENAVISEEQVEVEDQEDDELPNSDHELLVYTPFAVPNDEEPHGQKAEAAANESAPPPAEAQSPKEPEIIVRDDSASNSGEAAQLSANSRQRHEQLLHLSQLDSTFPPPIRGQFQPSEFQRAVLSHMIERREMVGHKMGLVVMATAVGKTVLAILDIQNEIEQMRLENSKLVKPAVRNSAIDSFVLRDDPVLSDNDDFVTMPPAHASISVSQKPFRLLFLVHTKAIRDATYTKFSEHFRARGFPNNSFLNVQATNSFSPHSLRRAQFIFCLFQSFERVGSEIAEHVTHVIIDECHHLLATTYREVYRTLVHSSTLRYCLGMTATLIHREDPAGATLKEMFRGQVYIDFPWTVAKSLGHFPKVEYLECLPTLSEGRDIPTYDALLSSFLSGQISLSNLLTRLELSADRCGMTAEKVKDILTARYITEMVLQYQESRKKSGLQEKRKIILFAANCEDADEIAALFLARKVSAVSAHYKSAKQASTNLQQFCQSDIAVLCTVMMVNEGFDSAEVDCVVMARLTESEIVFVQQMGRGLRKSRKNKGKEVCIIDLALNLRRRWRRLQKETSDRHLIQLLKEFWHVDNFVGVNFK